MTVPVQLLIVGYVTLNYRQALKSKSWKDPPLDHRIEISSLLVNRLKNNHDDFAKYDIDVSLDEVENNEAGIKLKYRIVLLSNPTNTKITVEGLVAIYGNDTEVAKQLAPDQRNIPLIVSTIYQDIFPLVYIVCKSMQIPVPAYKLSQIASTTQNVIPEAPTERPTIESEPAEQSPQSPPVQEAGEDVEVPPEAADAPVIQ